MSSGKVIKRANPNTIQDKFLVGYQGWFTCPGDGLPVATGHHGWLHWLDRPLPEGGHPNIDLWPDTSEYPPSELFPVPGLKYKSGEPAMLFSSRKPLTVRKHFNWMAQHSVDGAFLQRFVEQVDLEAGSEGTMRIREEVGDHVRAAAEMEGRVFAIMYDVTGVRVDRIQTIIERDWTHLLRDKRILESPAYLKEKGKPVIGLWGFGFSQRGHAPAHFASVAAFLRKITPGSAYIFAGTPAHWRLGSGDSDPDPGWRDMWLKEADAISPWTIGRYKDAEDVDRWEQEMIIGDIDCVKKWNEGVEMGRQQGEKVDYIPVVLPGASGFNMSGGRWGFNDIRRNGGKFLWKQVVTAKRHGARSMYGAMWDEYDEGTAMMPAISKKRLLPEHDKFPFIALDEDGYDLPPDWYMRICGFAAEALRSERMIFESFPVKELQDYWATRPKYEDAPVSSAASGSGSGSTSMTSAYGGSGNAQADEAGAAYAAWLAQQKEEKDEPPPPPYSLESDETDGAVPIVQTQSPQPQIQPLPATFSSPSVRPQELQQSQPTSAQVQLPGASPAAVEAPGVAPISWPVPYGAASHPSNSSNPGVSAGYGAPSTSTGGSGVTGSSSPASGARYQLPGPNAGYVQPVSSGGYGAPTVSTMASIPRPHTAQAGSVASHALSPSTSASGASIVRPGTAHSHSSMHSLTSQFSQQSLTNPTVPVPPVPNWPQHASTLPAGSPGLEGRPSAEFTPPVPATATSAPWQQQPHRPHHAQTTTSTPVTPVASPPVPSPGQAVGAQWPPPEWNVRPGKPSAYPSTSAGPAHSATSSLPPSQASHASPHVGAFGLGRISSYGATKPSGEPAYTQPYQSSSTSPGFSQPTSASSSSSHNLSTYAKPPIPGSDSGYAAQTRPQGSLSSTPGGGPQFPTGPADSGYSGSQPYPPQQQQYPTQPEYQHASSQYPGQADRPPYNAFAGALNPSPGGVGQPTSSYSGSEPSVPPPPLPPRIYGQGMPPPPPRPVNHVPYPPSPAGGPSFPTASNPLGFAFDAVGSFAGEQRRRQLEQGVASLASTGTKLLGRFGM